MNITKKLRNLLVLSIELSIISSFIALSYAAPPEKATGNALEVTSRIAAVNFDRETALTEKKALHQKLMSKVVKEGLTTPMRISVSSAEMEQINKDSSWPVKVGLTKSVNNTISFADINPRQLSGVAKSRPHGAIRRASDGGYDFSTVIESTNASALRVQFTNFWLPKGVELYLLAENEQVFGPYTGSGPNGNGNFWSHTLQGEKIILQLHQPGPISDLDLKETWFVISSVSHIGSKFLAGTHCDFNASCVENADCPATNSAVDDARLGVALMLFNSGPFTYICSGGLLADTDDSSDIPYFLTANHCLSRNKDAGTLETFFQLTAPCGTSDCTGILTNHPQQLRTLGSKVQISKKESDFTLLKLKEAAPAGSSFLGWNATTVAFSNSSLYRISHPQGAPQAYSEHQVDMIKPTCNSWPRGAWIYSKDLMGATEGGSSGSPVVNSSGQVVGQLTGACGYNVSDSCDTNSNATVDGSFANYFKFVAQFLDPSVSQCTPNEANESSCGDALDNDCDTLVDCADPDCSVNPSCSANSCSGGNEKGRRRCNDGIDNDNDGCIDNADPDC